MSTSKTHAVQEAVFQYSIWRTIVRHEQSRMTPSSDDEAEVLSLLFNTAEPHQAHQRDIMPTLLKMYPRSQASKVRQVATFVYEVIKARQENMYTSAIKQGQTISQASSDQDTLNTIEGELSGKAHEKGFAGFVFWEGNSTPITLHPTFWVSIPKDSSLISTDLSGQSSQRKASPKKAAIFLTGFLGAIIIFILFLWSLWPENPSAGQQSTIIFNATQEPTWSDITLQTDTQTLDGIVVTMHPLTICPSRPITTTGILTVTTKNPLTHRSYMIGGDGQDLIIACGSEPGLHAQLATTFMSQEFELDTLKDIHVWAADMYPNDIAPTHVRIDLVWDTPAYQRAQIVLPDGTQISPSQIDIQETQTRISYLVPASNYQQLGLRLEQEETLTFHSSLEIPAATDRSTFLLQHLNVDVDTPVWTDTGISIPVRVSTDSETAIVLSPRDVTITQAQKSINVLFDITSISQEPVDIQINVVNITPTGSLDCLLFGHPYRIEW